MKRMVVALVVAMMMLLGPAAAAFANHEHANCLGEHASFLNQINPGSGGTSISAIARHHDPGRMGQFAVDDPCQYRFH